MHGLVRALTRVDDGLAMVEEWVLIALVAAMSGVVFLQVIYRYALAQPLQWSEELARYLFAWICLLGAALGVRKRAHFGINFFLRVESVRAGRIIMFSAYLVMGIVAVALLVNGVFLVQKTAAQRSPAMEISMAWPYACVPAGAALMLVHLFSLALREAANGKRDPGRQ